MATLTLDTHDFIKGLMEAGMPEQQAEALADGLRQVNLSHVVTRDDLTEFKADIQAEFTDLRVELKDVKIGFLMWVIPLLLGQTAVFAALMKWLVG